MPPTTEVLIFGTSEAARADPTIVTPAFDLVLKAEGVHKPIYYGLQIGNPETGYCFLNWDTFEHHEAIMKAPSYNEVLDALKPAGNGKQEMYHVEFSAPAINAFEKPVTEVVVMTLKAPENRETVVDILSKISEASGKMLVFGKTREDENKYIIVGGWGTVQENLEAAAKPEVDAALKKLYSLANRDHFYHTKLSKYPS